MTGWFELSLDIAYGRLPMADDGRHIRAADRPAGTRRRYLGDGVYAADDGWGGVWLTAEDGICATEAIYIAPEVSIQLVRYLQGRDV